MKQIPIYPRKDHAVKTAREFIVKSGISSLPVDPFKLYAKYGWTIKSISQIKAIEAKHNLNMGYDLNCDAKTYLTDKGEYLTIYDGAVSTDGRILWTIAHEMGHIVLNHMEDFEQTEIHKGLTEDENGVLEAEANAFVSELLAPSEVLLRCSCTTREFIKKLCNLSKEASENKEASLIKYRPKAVHENVDKHLFRQFFHYINSKIYYHKIHVNICTSCRNYIISKEERFCRICGTMIRCKTLGQGIIYNDGFDTDSAGKAIICPNCFNEYPSNDNSYTCSQCGTVLVNMCSSNTEDCPKIHDTSSRYCSNCGSATTFYLKELLKPSEIYRCNDSLSNIIMDAIYNDAETGKVFNDWNYILNLIKEEGVLSLYHSLKGSIAKLDYDTLYIFSHKQITAESLSDPDNLGYLMELIYDNTGISIFEILTRKL